VRGAAKATVSLVLIIAIVASHAIASSNKAQINWQNETDKALVEAQHLSRPLFVYFTAKWCPACLRLDRTVFVDKRVVQFITEHCVAVRLDADAASDITEKWKVERLPTAIIVSADGRTQNRIEGYRPAEQYLAELSSLVNSKPLDTPSLHQLSRASVRKPNSNPRAQTQATLDHRIELASRSVKHAPPSRSRMEVQIRLQEEPNLMIDGTCVVSMLESRKILSGDPQFVVSSSDATFWFAGREELERFRADPDRYVPVLNGLCVTSLTDDGLELRGQVKSAAIYRNRLFLFAGPEQRQRFQANPKRYFEFAQETASQRNPH
jgi:thioredoxin-related protein/YHS domain-containing protein